MKDFNTEVVPYWKALARDKDITLVDTVNYCILKAMNAKNPDKESVAAGLMQAAFTPVTNTRKYENNGKIAYHGLYCAYQYTPSSDANRLKHFALTTEEEYMQFTKLMDYAKKEMHKQLSEYYTYLIVRQDISPEQQAVQTNHASIKLGATLLANKLVGVGFPASYNALNHLNLVLIGVPTEDDVRGAAEYIYSCGYETVEFREPDIAKTPEEKLNGGQVTAIASMPVKSTKRRFMKRYKRLSFAQPAPSVVEYRQ